MQNQSIINNFSPNEIVCLKHNNKSLYCEVIQIVEKRNMGWVRPVMLVNISDNIYYNLDEKAEIYDLRLSSDLLWDLSVFLPVLDTEYITFFCKLEELDWNEKNINFAKQKLKHFLEEIF